MKKQKRLTEIIEYRHPRVRVEIFYDNAISTIEAKEIANKLIIEEKVLRYTRKQYCQNCQKNTKTTIDGRCYYCQKKKKVIRRKKSGGDNGTSTNALYRISKNNNSIRKPKKRTRK